MKQGGAPKPIGGCTSVSTLAKIKRYKVNQYSNPKGVKHSLSRGNVTIGSLCVYDQNLTLYLNGSVMPEKVAPIEQPGVRDFLLKFFNCKNMVIKKLFNLC